MILNANITLDLQFSPGLHVAIQKNDLQKVLLNLINNAVEAFITESSAAHVYRLNTITICTTLSFDSALLSISDNGRGIPSEKMPSFFDRLANDQEKATGLSLWLCQHIIHRYDGGFGMNNPARSAVDLLLNFLFVRNQQTCNNRSQQYPMKFFDQPSANDFSMR